MFLPCPNFPINIFQPHFTEIVSSNTICEGRLDRGWIFSVTIIRLHDGIDVQRTNRARPNCILSSFLTTRFIFKGRSVILEETLVVWLLLAGTL